MDGDPEDDDDDIYNLGDEDGEGGDEEEGVGDGDPAFFGGSEGVLLAARPAAVENQAPLPAEAPEELAMRKRPPDDWDILMVGEGGSR